MCGRQFSRNFTSRDPVSCKRSLPEGIWELWSSRLLAQPSWDLQGSALSDSIRIHEKSFAPPPLSSRHRRRRSSAERRSSARPRSARSRARLAPRAGLLPCMRARALCGQSRSPNAGAVETLRRWRRAAPVADRGGDTKMAARVLDDASSSSPGDPPVGSRLNGSEVG